MRVEGGDEGQVGGQAAAENNSVPNWGQGNFGVPLNLAPAANAPPAEAVVIDWDAINANREEDEKARWAHLPEMFKNFYTEHPDVTRRSDEEVALFRRASNNIVVENFNEVNCVSAVENLLLTVGCFF